MEKWGRMKMVEDREEYYKLFSILLVDANAICRRHESYN
jgi:hypothetical protein